MPPRASKVCLRPSRPIPKSASKSLLLRPRPFTKGGLAVVRPRRASSINPPDHLGESWACSEPRHIIFLLRRCLPQGRIRLGHAPPPAARHSARRRATVEVGGTNPLGNSLGFWLLGHLGAILALSSLILASKTPLRPPKTPPRCPQEPPRRHQEPPRRVLGASIRSVILEDFRF